MIAAIGPFWDANETWLVLAVGLLLVAFPAAHGIILTALYLPVFVLLVGLILRGVAFDFRAKVPTGRKQRWNRIFLAGSLIASLAEGYMLGVYVLGLGTGFWAVAFGLLVALCLAAAYAAMGARLVDLQDRGRASEEGGAVAARRAGADRARHGRRVARHAASPAPASSTDGSCGREMLYLSPLPILSGLLFLWLWWQTFHLPKPGDRHALAPFLTLAGIFCARLLRAGLVVLPLRRARPADHLAGGLGP